MSKALEQELKELRAKADAQFWSFSRCAKASPVDPAITRRIAEIEDLLGFGPQWWKRTKAQVYAAYGMPENKHKEKVIEAITLGKPVPLNVLEEYPDLLESHNESA